MKKILFIATIALLGVTACRKTNNPETPNPINNNFSVSVEAKNNQLNLLAGEDTATILISITSSVQTSTYTLVASDTTIYNNTILPNNTIISNAKPRVTYMIGYTSKVSNPTKVLTFTVTDNNGNQELQNITFNIRTGFVANVYPTSPSVYFGGIDSLVVNIKTAPNISGNYRIQFNSDTVYYQSLQYDPSVIIILNNGATDTLIYKALTTPFNARQNQLDYRVLLSTMTDNPQVGSTTINLLNNSFDAIITPLQNIIYKGFGDTVTIAIANIANQNTTYSLKIDSPFIYKGMAYTGGSRVMLQNIRGNNGLDSVIFQGKNLGGLNPTCTITNSLPDSNITRETGKLQLTVGGITLVSPADGATNQPIQPIFVWNNTNPQTTSYKVYYGTNQNSLVQDLKNYTVSTNLSDTIRISPDDGTTSPYLSYGTQYYWKVVGINASGARVDSASSSFTVRNALNLNTVRYQPGIAVYNDSLYVVGGSNSNGSNYFNSVEVFSTATGWRTATQTLNTPRAGFGLTVYNNSLYAVGGGTNSTSILSSVETFSPANGWQTAAQSLNKTISGLGLTLYKDTLFAIGGASDNFTILNSIETYTGGAWINSSASLITARHGFGIATANNKIYVVGGSASAATNVPLNTVEVYNGTNWAYTQPMNTERAFLGLATYKNKLYAAGGLSPGALYTNTMEIFDGTNWRYATPMPTPRFGFGFTEYNGLLYAVGGYYNNTTLSIVEIYNPATNQWQ
ncbi:MAG: kelch repeat-containing protein [Phycisphaerales bacterium]|nr:kelch repeat-containing protein [Phycisphaerales bacterium]